MKEMVRADGDQQPQRDDRRAEHQSDDDVDDDQHRHDHPGEDPKGIVHGVEALGGAAGEPHLGRVAVRALDIVVPGLGEPILRLGRERVHAQEQGDLDGIPVRGHVGPERAQIGLRGKADVLIQLQERRVLAGRCPSRKGSGRRRHPHRARDGLACRSRT